MIGTFVLVLFLTMLKEAYEVTSKNYIKSLIGLLKVQAG
jgi:hypothetical protein